MDTQKRKHLQDIYTTDRTTRDDYTPQVSADVIEERKRELRRHQFISSMLGLIVLMLGIALVYVVVREYIEINELASKPADPITEKYIPRYSLPSQSEWVLDYSDRSFGDPEWDGEGERPLNTEWLKKAAFNVILAEQSLQLEEFDMAAEHYENALAILPDIEGVRVPLGMAYFKLERFEDALEMFEMAPDSDLTPEFGIISGPPASRPKNMRKAKNTSNAPWHSSRATRKPSGTWRRSTRSRIAQLMRSGPSKHTWTTVRPIQIPAIPSHFT